MEGNEEEVREFVGEARTCTKPHERCRCDLALSFRTRRPLWRQEVALVHAHRTEGIERPREGKKGMGSGAGSESEAGTGT